MVRSVKNAVLRIMAEFAALKITQGLGLDSLLSFGGVGGIGGTGGRGINAMGALGTGANAFSLANLGKSAMSGIRGGFGIPTLIGRGLSMLPGSIGAFGTGMLGSAGAGAFSAAGGAGTAFIGGAGTALGGSGMGVAASMGSMAAAAAGPLVIAAAADMIFRALAGNKSTGSKVVDSIPIIGSLGSLLFGHGPMKFRQQVAIGKASDEGFDGRVTDVFRAKGGLLVGNKHKERSAGNESQLLKLFDETIGGFAKSAKSFADNLGISKDAITGYSKEIRLESEKGKTLTEEAIQGMLTSIGDDFARGLIPTIDELSKHGETAFQTLTRLNNEFSALETAGTLLGSSLANARQFLSQTSFEGRTAFVDAAGGIDALMQKANFFADNFLTDAERLAPSQERLTSELQKLGLSTDITKEQFKGLVQSFGSVGGISEETLQSLLNLQSTFIQVRDAADQVRIANEQLAAQERERGRIMKQTADQNMLTLAENFAPEEVIGIRLGLANEALAQFGLSADMSREKLTGLLREFVMSGGLYTDLADEVMNASDLYLKYINSIPKAIEDPKQALSTAYSMLQRSVEAERKRLTEEYNTELGNINTHIQDVTGSISKLKSLSDSLKSTVNQIRPLSRDEAKFQILSAINNAKRGIFPEAKDLQQALSVLGNSQNITGAKSSFELAREQAKTAILIEDLGSLTDSQLSVEEQSLRALETQRNDLNLNFADQMTRLDSMLEQGQKQIDALNKIDTTILSLEKALGQFNLRSVQAGGASIGGAKPSGNASISDQTIRDFIKTPGLSEMDIYNAAKKHGVSFEQYAAATGQNVQNLYDWARKKGLPTFAEGGYHKGGLRIVGEKGPELERTGPSHITSNKDMKKAIGNDEVIEKLDKLIEIFEAVTQGGTSIRTKAA